MTAPTDIAGGDRVPRFLVIQYGARHDYAIPAAFDRAGALAGMYTDLTSTHGIGALIKAVTGGRGPFAKMLARRMPPYEIVDRVHSCGTAYLAGEAVRRIANGPAADRRGYAIRDAIASRQMMRAGMRAATHVYTMFGEGGTFVRQVKEAGLGVVGDVYIALSADPIVAEEIRRFPDWSDEPAQECRVDEQAARNAVLLTQSDLLVCPSEVVRDDLVQNHGVEAVRTIVAPYAVSPRWLSLVADPEPGRILFAGSAILRKGIHYLAEAASLLRGECQVRVAGGVSLTVRNHPGAANLTFLGHLSPADMDAEFARADVFAFPSLAEGSASVTAEALGAGIPVVTTKAAGSIVRDGIDGIIVPERDPEALSEAVRSIVEDRKKRGAMARAARERAQTFTWDDFARNVITAVSQTSAPNSLTIPHPHFGDRGLYFKI